MSDTVGLQIRLQNVIAERDSLKAEVAKLKSKDQAMYQPNEHERQVTAILDPKRRDSDGQCTIDRDDLDAIRWYVAELNRLRVDRTAMLLHIRRFRDRSLELLEQLPPTE